MRSRAPSRPPPLDPRASVPAPRVPGPRLARLPGSAAVVLAATLVACSDVASAIPTPPADRGGTAARPEGGAPGVAVATPETDVAEPTVPTAPLAAEVAAGLPAVAGTYRVVPGSVFRDRQGTYQFEWLEAGAGADGTDPFAEASREQFGHVARASRLRLVRDDATQLEVTGTGDPVLHLTRDVEVGLADLGAMGGATGAYLAPGASYYPSPWGYWSPFYGRPLYWDYLRPWYYDPPRTVVVERPVIVDRSATGAPPVRVSGGSAGSDPAPLTQRTTQVTGKNGGRAGDLGAGAAVTARNQGADAIAPASKGESRNLAPGAAGSLGAAGAPARVGTGNVADAASPPRVSGSSSDAAAAAVAVAAVPGTSGGAGSSPPRVSSSGSSAGSSGVTTGAAAAGAATGGSSPPRVSSSGSSAGSSGVTTGGAASGGSPPRVSSSGSSGSSGGASGGSSGSSGLSGLFGGNSSGSSKSSSSSSGSSGLFGGSSSGSSRSSLPAPRSSSFSSGGRSSGGGSSA